MERNEKNLIRFPEIGDDGEDDKEPQSQFGRENGLRSWKLSKLSEQEWIFGGRWLLNVLIDVGEVFSGEVSMFTW